MARPPPDPAPPPAPPPGDVPHPRPPVAWIRLAMGIAVAGYAAAAALGFTAGGAGREEAPAEAVAGAVTLAALACARRRPLAASFVVIATIWIEVIRSIVMAASLEPEGLLVLPLLATAAGLLLGGRTALALAAVSGAVVPLVLLATGAWGPGAAAFTAADARRLIVFEAVLVGGALVTRAALAAYARALGASRRAQERLHHADRLERVGQLAGGVAHDFNNLLTVVGGHASVLLEHADAEVREAAADLLDAQRRGVALTRQLLAFARRDVRRVEVIDLAEAVGAVARLLERVAGDRHPLRLALAGPAPVSADRGQLEQVLVNLVANARDAMPGGGAVRVSVAPLAAEEARRLGSALPPRAQALLEVADDGVGIPPEQRERIFEPFFTTKPRGQGTGLGLATVHGIVTRGGGHVAVESAPGRGSAFRVFLPLAEGLPTVTPPPARGEAGPRGSERVLLVEDEPSVRSVAARVLAGAGYTVVEAGDAHEALAACDAGLVPEALVSDVSMPGPSGVELAATLRARWPWLPVLLVSGYPEDAAGAGAGEPGRDLLEKPFAPAELLRRLRKVIDGARRASGPEG